MDIYDGSDALVAMLRATSARPSHEVRGRGESEAYEQGREELTDRQFVALRAGLTPDSIQARITDGTLAKCDHFGTRSTSHWTGAAIIV